MPAPLEAAGVSAPLGATIGSGGVNFSVFSRDATSIDLLLFDDHEGGPDRVITLDRVLEYLDTSTIRPKNVEGVKADPPILFYSTRPAIIINLDGDPVWSR